MKRMEFYSLLNQYILTNHLGVAGTIMYSGLDGCPVGSKLLVNETGDPILGLDDPELMHLLMEPIQEVLRLKQPKVITLSHVKGEVKVFLDPILPQARLLILGGGHIAVPLAEMGHLLEYHVSVVDDRLSFAHPDRFPHANRVLCQDFETAIREFSFDANTYVIIVTRGHRHDKTCLAEVLLKSEPAYIGMIGSRRKVAAILDDLREEGYDDEQLNRVYAPIGLDIGAQTPAEIAVSIIAEMVMVSRFGYSHGLKMAQGGKSIG